MFRTEVRNSPLYFTTALGRSTLSISLDVSMASGFLKLHSGMKIDFVLASIEIIFTRRVVMGALFLSRIKVTYVTLNRGNVLKFEARVHVSKADYAML